MPSKSHATRRQIKLAIGRSYVKDYSQSGLTPGVRNVDPALLKAALARLKVDLKQNISTSQH